MWGLQDEEHEFKNIITRKHLAAFHIAQYKVNTVGRSENKIVTFCKLSIQE